MVKEEKKEEKAKKGKNIVELLTGGEDIGEFARKLNLDPEMAEKMLVPLLSLLDKYGVGDTITMVLDLSCRTLKFYKNSSDKHVVSFNNVQTDTNYRMAVYTFDTGDSVTLIDYFET